MPYSNSEIGYKSVFELNKKTRKENLEIIKNSLSKNFKDKIVNAVVYGSTLLEDFNASSDYDVLLTIDNPTMLFMKQLKELRISERVV